MNTKTTLNGIWEFINSKVFLYICVAIFALLLFNSFNNKSEYEREITILEQNINAKSDSIKQEILKNKNLQLSINGYISSEKDLKNLNKDLADKVEQQKGQIITLNSANIKLIQKESELNKYIDILESRLIDSEKENDSTYRFNWALVYEYDSLKNDSLNYDKFKGSTRIGYYNNEVVYLNTYLTERETSIDLTFGQKVEDGQLRVYVNSPYPGFTTSSLSGVLIDPNTNPYMKDLMKKRQWFPGTWNVSVGTSIGYDIQHGGASMVIGASIGYTIFQW